MTRRSQAREVALLLLFQLDLNPQVSREDVVAFARAQLAEQEEAIAFALSLYDGAVAARAALDERLGKAAENWRISRMATIDRNILRLGAYELTHATDLPVGVVFNEAIELARRYGSADSPAFVNGVLDRMNRERREPAAAVDAPPPAPAAP